MTLHTMLPLELVLQGFDQEPEPTCEVWSGDVKLEIVPVAQGMGRIVRVLQCKLEDYLRPELTPGSIIYYAADNPNR
ncbi:YlzJ-like family protein [Paenibacillus soyae]|uniref:YlzJ-like family protein n=1 Tax=Paenibacillus soyae TaxID=2969249 RepID=A0A9X2SBL8_9BACL|nr:YlzJ-like family protein [Paenibacillus soyae]MCR2805072.1 YlzJ-like family protein [Paenibacillus soyae]